MQRIVAVRSQAPLLPLYKWMSDLKACCGPLHTRAKEEQEGTQCQDYSHRKNNSSWGCSSKDRPGHYRNVCSLSLARQRRVKKGTADPDMQTATSASCLSISVRWLAMDGCKVDIINILFSGPQCWSGAPSKSTNRLKSDGESCVLGFIGNRMEELRVEGTLASLLIHVSTFISP
nr:uncharacterized protein LOC119620266 [Chlorocebus sabaeus]